MIGYLSAPKSKTDGVPVAVSFKAEKRHLNVAGFVKFAFNFKMMVRGKNVLTTSFEESGRSKEQAAEMARASLKKYLEEKVPLLEF